MRLFDFAFVIEEMREIKEIVWNNPLLKEKYDSGWSFKKGSQISDILSDVLLNERGEITLDSDVCLYERFSLSPAIIVSLFSLKNEKSIFFEQALELFSEGIQIYDKKGYMLYCNRESRRISAIPDSMEIIGKHMLEVWNVREEKSATFSCFKKGAPVKNIVDTFSTSSAGEVTTINSAYPISQNGEIKGAVLFERDIVTIQKRKNELETSLKALTEYTAAHPPAKLLGYTFEHIIGNSAPLRSAVKLARKFASLNLHILLIGETGTGKEMFAQSIHSESDCSEKKFVAINCAALPDTLIESTLFGTAKGAFTGSENKAGLFEEANGGTLFLDELNSMSLAMQSKILRVIQEGRFRRIGGDKDFIANVRVISACNEDPYLLVEKGKMRRDLFYRLSSVQIQIPPLRERLDDIEPLIERYIHLKKYQFAKAIDYVDPEVLKLFYSYQWPGNVRELFHVLDYAMNVMEGGVIDISCLPSYIIEKSASKPFAVSSEPDIDVFHSKLENIIGDYEAKLLKQVLEHYGNNISHAAKSLGISRQSLYYRLRKYGIVI